MADPQHVQFLLQTLNQQAGRKRWLDFKLRARWIDLAAADFTSADLRDYDLSDLNLSTAIFLEADLAGTDLADSILTYADLRRATLRNACLDRADLSGANLQNADLVDACMEDVNLGGARLQGANLIGADLAGANLEGADLRGASLKFARLTGARVRDANVADADLTGAVMDDEAPALFKHFDLSVVDDRKYRVMRSKVKTGSDQLLPVLSDKPRPQEPPRQPAGKPKKPVPAGDRVEKEGDFSVPLRDAEPDLSSEEGCCRVLEIQPGASTIQIVQSFRAKAKLYHPDKVRHLSERIQELAAEEFRRVRQAYEFMTRQHVRPMLGINWAEGVPHYDSPYDYTIAHYEALAAVNPGNVSILYNLAWKYFEEGRMGDAIAGFEKVLRVSPDDEDALYNLMIVRLYVELGLPPGTAIDRKLPGWE